MVITVKAKTSGNVWRKQWQTIFGLIIDNISLFFFMLNEWVSLYILQASCTLEAGVKIYLLSVDSVHSEACKVLGGINRAGQKMSKVRFLLWWHLSPILFFAIRDCLYEKRLYRRLANVMDFRKFKLIKIFSRKK